MQSSVKLYIIMGIQVLSRGYFKEVEEVISRRCSALWKVDINDIDVDANANAHVPRVLRTWAEPRRSSERFNRLPPSLARHPSALHT